MKLLWHQEYEGGRIVAKMGQIEVGAVFPGDPVRWSFWLRNSFVSTQTAKSESAAKNAVLAATLDWLRLAGLGYGVRGTGRDEIADA